VDWCATFSTGEVEYVAGQLYFATGYQPDPTEQATGWVHAVNAEDGTMRWRFEVSKPVVAGVTSTAGGLVFTGDIGGTFYAFDKNTGDVLHRIETGGSIAGGVVTYSVGGRQYVAFTSGNVSRGGFEATGSPKLVVMALDAPEMSMYSVALPEVNGKGLVSSQPAVVRGEQVFAGLCTGCHGARGEQGVADAGRRTIEALTEFIKEPTGAMPRLYPQPLDEAEVTAVATYVQEVLQGGR
jgi:mono/diheme cytochrome c family protein